MVGEKSDLQPILVAMFANLFVECCVDSDNCVFGWLLHVGKCWEIFIRRSKRCRLLRGWLQDEVEVHLPVVAKTVVGVALDLPCTRIAGRLSVTAADTDIDILECHVS